MNISKFISIHNQIRDKIWDSLIRGPRCGKFLLWVPRTDNYWNKVIHFIDDKFTFIVNFLLQLFWRVVLIFMVLLVISAFLYYMTALYWMVS